MQIYCERLPKQLRETGAITRDCLGDLDVATLLEMALAAGSGTVVLANPGFCNTCPAGGESVPPGAPARAEAARLLSGMALEALEPVLRDIKGAGFPRDDSAARRRERRGFLRRLAGSGKRPRAGKQDPVAARAATLTALRRLAQRFGAPLPAAFFPSLVASDRCQDHAVCNALCKSGALTRYADGDRRGLRFDPALCTSCAECVRHCPERALSLTPSELQHPAIPTVRLTSHAIGLCERCENEFVSAGQGEICPECRKDAALFATLKTGAAQ